MSSLKRLLHLSIFSTIVLAAKAHAESHIFTTKEGRYLRGELIQASGDQLVLRTVDGQTLTLAVNSLIGADQDYVSARQSGAVREVRHNFEVTWDKEKVKSSMDTMNHTKVTKSTYVTHVKIRNKSDQASGDLTLHYQLYYNDVEGNKTILKHKDGRIKLPSMQAGATTSVDTDTLELKFLQLVDGYRYTNGAPQRQVDAFKGIAVMFMDKDKQVFEYVAPGITKAP